MTARHTGEILKTRNVIKEYRKQAEAVTDNTKALGLGGKLDSIF